MPQPPTQGEVSQESTGDIGSVLRAELRDEFAASAAVTDAAMEDLATLAPGSGMLVVKRGPNTGAVFALNKSVVSAGRHPASDVFLDDITVSRRHAEFRRENDRFHVVDLGSLNNTYVNRKPVDSAMLADGDEIQIGNFRLVFVTGPATPAMG